jgi:hypothetical protein
MALIILVGASQSMVALGMKSEVSTGFDPHPTQHSIFEGGGYERFRNIPVLYP